MGVAGGDMRSKTVSVATPRKTEMIVSHMYMALGSHPYSWTEDKNMTKMAMFSRQKGIWMAQNGSRSALGVKRIVMTESDGMNVLKKPRT